LPVTRLPKISPVKLADEIPVRFPESSTTSPADHCYRPRRTADCGGAGQGQAIGAMEGLGGRRPQHAPLEARKSTRTAGRYTAERWPQPALVPFQSSAKTSAHPANSVFKRHRGTAGPNRFRAETENHPSNVHDPFRVVPRVGLSRCSFVPQGSKPQPKRHAGMHHIWHQVDRKGGTDGLLCKPIANFTVPHGLSGADLRHLPTARASLIGKRHVQRLQRTEPQRR
jgi:hypothetical protein